MNNEENGNNENNIISASNDFEIIKPSFEILHPSLLDLQDYPRLIERFGRTCYKSEGLIGKKSPDEFCKKIIRRGHESVLEHLSITVLFIGDRSFSHQLVRHRIAAYSQESQRYCSYGQHGKKGKIKTILPPNILKNSEALAVWEYTMDHLVYAYDKLLSLGIPPEDARSLLPNATKTEIVTTCNIRTWRHIFDMRVNYHAQWEIRELMTNLLLIFYKHMPCLFEDKIKKFNLPDMYAREDT